jgi:LacI family transcriptional regulator
MADVARRADVSIKTVSRVVNAEPGVSPATAARVRESIDKLGFHRHAAATILRTGRSDRIGLVAADLVNPFYGQLAAGIEREARLRRHLLISTSSQQSTVNEAELVEALVAQRVAGLVVVPVDTRPSGALRAAARSVPVVCVDRPQPDLGVDTVLSDNEGGMRSAVEHLAAHRHERLGFLGDDRTIWTARVRQAAFDSAAASLGLCGPLRSRLGPYEVGEIAGLLREWTSGPDPVTAVVTGNNRVTVAVLHAIRELGVPLALVGYDDFELADVVDPPVTVVHQDPLELGGRAVQQVFARLAAGAGEPRTVIIPTRLIVRGSGRSRPSGDRDRSPALATTAGPEVVAYPVV